MIKLMKFIIRMVILSAILFFYFNNCRAGGNDVIGKIRFDYYDQTFTFSVPAVFNEKFLPYYDYAFDDISSQVNPIYRKLHREIDPQFIEQLKNIQQIHHYNDHMMLWLIYRIIKDLSYDMDHRNFLLWYIGQQMNWKVALAFRNHITFLVSYREHIGSIYYVENDIKYYAEFFDGPVRDEGSCFIVEALQPGLKKASNQVRMPSDFIRIKYRSVNFEYQNKQYHFDFAYNSQLVEYQDHLDYFYFDTIVQAPTSSIFRRSLHDNLDNILHDMNEYQAVDFLMKLIQFGFRHQPDHDQFGREKPVFPEEFLHYPYADCEDRSIFFLAVVKELLGLKGVLLIYPQHMIPAIEFNQSVKGSCVTYKGKEFYFCEVSGETYYPGRIPDSYINCTVENFYFN